MTEPKPILQPESIPTPQDNESPPQGQKEKLRSVMEAASALTSLGDEESGSRPTSPKSEDKPVPLQPAEAEDKAKKRFLPEHKKADAAPTFPEKVRSQQTRHGGLLPVVSPTHVEFLLGLR